MDDDEARLFRKERRPSQKVVAIGVRGEAVERVELRLDGDFLARYAHRLSAVDDAAAQRAVGLVADEEYVRVFFIKAVLEVVHYAAAGAHAAAREDYAVVHRVYRARLLRGADEAEAARLEGVVAAREHLLQLAREQRLVLGVYLRRLDAHRRIEVDVRHFQVGEFFLQKLELVEHPLSAVDDEGRYQHLAARADGGLHRLLELGAGILERLVQPVAVGRLDEHEVRLFDDCGRLFYNSVERPEVAGEDDLHGLLHALFGNPRLYDGAAQNVARLAEAHAEARKYLDYFVVWQRAAVGERVLDVPLAVERLDWRQPLARVLARAPLRVFLHDARGVAQEHLDELRRRVRAVYLAFEAELDEKRYPSAVVYVRVREQHGVDSGGVVGEALALVTLLVRPLVRSAVDEHFVPSGLYHVIGAGYFSGSA